MTVSTENPADLQHAVVHQAVTAARVAAALERMGAELAGKNAAIDQLAAHRAELQEEHRKALQAKDDEIAALKARNDNLAASLERMARLWTGERLAADSEGGTPE